MTRFFNGTMLFLAVAVIVLCAFGFHASGLRIEVHQLYPKFVLYAAVLAGAVFFRRRGIDAFVAALLIVFWMGLLCDLHVFPMFLAGRRDLPYQDAWLADLDGRLGLEVPAILG